jgi:hypothetical protein
LNREDAISLLRELMFSCESFRNVTIVSIDRDKEREGCSLSVTWVPEYSEKGCLNAIAVKRGLEITTTDRRMVFHSSP